MKHYINPELELVLLSSADVIVCSGDGSEGEDTPSTTTTPGDPWS